jgi:putative transposase
MIITNIAAWKPWWIALHDWIGSGTASRTQGMIELLRQKLKNRILLNNYDLPRDLEDQITTLVDNYSLQRRHESLNNLTPADVYFGSGQATLKERARIKKLTIHNRRLQHRLKAA